MSSFPGSPRLAKGAIIGFDLLNPLARIAVFQYNPDSVTRTLQPQASGDDGARAEAMRLRGAPVETIKMEVEIDATDELETGEGTATKLGIYPQLSALEMLIYPKSALIIANTVLLATANLRIVPPIGIYTFLVWGFKRVVPVRLTDLTITEEAHDAALNPIRAKASLGLRVLSYNDLPLSDPGYYVFLVHQIAKEAFAMIGSAGNARAVGGGDVKLF